MMKFYKKKEVSLEKTPILFRLERRHTLLDGGKHESAEDESRRASRANSVGSYTRAETPTNIKRSATLSKLCLSDGSRSNLSAASVVITESELSSSWLYKARKAKIDSDDENISASSNVPTEDNDMQPVPLRDPNLKPVSVPLKPRQEKISSCCCHLLVAITICIASLGIMAAIGGIVYLEVFAAYKEVSEGKHASQISPLDADSGRKGGNGDSLQNKFRNLEEDIIFSSSEANFPESNESLKKVTNPMVNNSKGVFDPGEQSNIKYILDKDSVLQKEDWDNDESFSNIHVSQDNNVSVVKFLQENQDEIEVNEFSQDNSNFDGVDPNHEPNLRFPEIVQEISDNALDANEEHLNSSKTANSLNEDVDFENMFGFESKSDDDYLEELGLNRPVVEAKPPIEFQKRLVGNQNEDPNQSFADMDRKFSLSEILKHLRTLDVNNKLPSSRQKDVVTEMARTSHQDIGSERKEYLSNLRRKIYN